MLENKIKNRFIMFHGKKKGVKSLQILGRRCIACESCMEVCPRNVFGMMYKDDCSYATIEYRSRCVGCGKCQEVCPVDAIELITASLITTK